MISTILGAADAGSWVFGVDGYPVWLVLPLAAAAFWAIRRLSARELDAQRPVDRRKLGALRGAAAVFVVLLLLEPTCTFRGSRTELPTIAVLLDTSGSMAVQDAGMLAHHRLNEGVALGLVPADLRDTTPMRVAATVEEILSEAVAFSGALADLQQGDGDGRGDEGRVAAAARAAAHVETLKQLAPGVAGLAAVSAGIADIRSLLEQVVAALAKQPAQGVAAGTARVSVVIEDLGRLQQNGRDVARRCREAQRFSDAALVAAAEEGSPIASGLAELSKLSRFDRARMLVRQKVMPVVEGKARLRVHAMERSLEPLEKLIADGGARRELMGPTDLEAPLAELAGSSSERLAGVLIVSDGRQTVGGDPIGAVRALAARGTRLGTILVGDPETPRDAVVGEIVGSSEVFLGETIRLDVRFRISGFRDEPWNLILSRPAGEIERRTVRGTGRWQQERFEFRADEAGISQITARLSRVGGGPEGTGHGILREFWTGIGGSSVADLTGSARFDGPPDGAAVVGEFACPSDWADNYGTRVRGYVVPPLTGSYTFWISSDDGSELWLSTDRTPQNKSLIGKVSAWTAARDWEKEGAQKSKPIALRAGERYYIEALQKEGSGGDNLAVGWQLPDSTLERPIPGERLLPYREGADEKDAAPVSAEASPDNNHAQIVVAVSEDPLRALLVDGMPRWESRYIVTLLERDRRVELVRTYRSIEYPRGRTAMLPETQEELDGFDVVVLGDLRPQELSSEAQQRLASFVARRGGFLIVLAGPRGMPGEYNLGAIADVLPVRNVPDTSPAAAVPSRAGATLVLGEAVSSGTVSAVLDDVALNAKLWPSLPPLTWVARNVAAKIGAEVLLRTDDGSQTPIVAVARHGAGRVLYVGTDETWRWRDRLGERVHQTFWLQALRWGLGERLRGKDPRLQVSLDRSLVSPGEVVELRARARTGELVPVANAPHVAVRRVDRPAEGDADAAAKVEREIEMIRVPDTADTWRVPVENLDEGRWLLTVRCDHPELRGVSEQREIVVRRAHGEEAIELGADQAAMERIAKAGGFKAGGLADAEALARELIEGAEARVHVQVKTFTLWDSYAALAVAASLLLTEWVWRRRLGMP